LTKRTEELLHELKECASISSFLTENQESFTAATLAEQLANLMDAKDIKRAALVRSSGLSEVYAYQILAGTKNPERDKILCLAFALGTSPDEANRLLASGGKAPLYPKNQRDSVLIYGLSKHLAVPEINDLLFELGQATLT